MKIPKDIKAGDIIGFSGRSWWSVAINLFTGGLPFWGLSHVGIMGKAKDGRLLLWESTDEADLPCEIAGKKIIGVQAHLLGDVVSAYRGRVWHYPLYRGLFNHENHRLTTFLSIAAGKNYDTVGAIRSGGIIFSLISSLIHAEDLAMLFCSELAAASLSKIGVFPTTNASYWSPNKLMRKLRRNETILPPRRIK